MSNIEIAKIVGMSPQTTSQYYSRYKKEGKKIFKVKSAGRPKKSWKRLTDEQERDCPPTYQTRDRAYTSAFNRRRISQALAIYFKKAKADNADIWWADETSYISLPTNLKE